MNMRTKKWLAASLSLLVLCLALTLATRILTPKRFDYGSTWGQFLKEPKDSIDVLFFGTSKVYCDVVPAVIWERSGVHSYLLAGASQTIPITYYSVCEALKTQSPQAVFVEVSGLVYPRHTDYTQINLGYLPRGRNRLQAVLGEAEDPSHMAELFFPILSYHSRWNQLTGEDFRVGLGGYDADPLAGYTFLTTSSPMEEHLLWQIAQTPADFERNFSFLEKIADLCRSRGITSVFYVAPSFGIFPGDAPKAIPQRVQALQDVVWTDFNTQYPAIGLNDQTDYHDFLHFNRSGAAVFSAYLSDWMQENLDVTPIQTKNPALWAQRVQTWRELSTQPLVLR